MASNLDSRQLLVYALCVLAVVAVGVRYLKKRDSASRLEQAAPQLRVSAPKQSLAVHITGAVKRPGLYWLRGGRVDDAVKRAGGVTTKADLNSINLAAKLSDGQQVVVPSRGTVGSELTQSGEKVGLNSATLEQLDTLEGVGPETAKKILDYRSEHGGFSSVDDLKQISGIGEKRFESLKESVQP